MEFSHKTVLLREAVEGLNIRPDGIYVDGTAGGGGHSAEIAARLKKGMLYSFDRDAEAIAAAGKRLAGLRAELIHAEFSRMKGELAARGVSAVDGILLDLGVSSHQLDDAERGFSYSQDAPLDMRMSSTGMTAAELLNTAPQAQIERILRVYGEEKFSSRIASKICARREENPLSTTGELAEIIRESIPAAARREGGNPCKRTFQAVRIAVNDELGELERVLEEGFSLLAPGGRFVII
ncbi:MAG: 16S rRNA (cytosine(1402)-N(4))-methyltransferase RsmH, partial [Ruminococcaceae bacterium]|nr:16S rRNA (cytosine(1402)-N(4))-methyltransferase RsmH [Oscillospiraceae bacterium]